MIHFLVLTNKVGFLVQRIHFSSSNVARKLINPSGALLLISFIILSFCPQIAQSDASQNPVAYKADPNKGKQIAGGVCAGCHGSDGNSIIPINPILAGQHDAYIQKQLHNFQVKQGNEKAMRENAIMLGFASGLNDEQIADVAAYYNQQKIRPSFTKNKDLALKGESLYKGGDVENGIPACSSCHGPKGAGIPSQYPRLAGQYTEYTTSSLLSYKKGTRANNKQMMSISKRMSDEQIKAVSEYLAGLR